ncbi:hypothetical protein B0H14DRAFT_2820100, partial [Mycena olivaceomarginata]
SSFKTSIMTVCFQSKLPQVDGLPHCLSPLLVWLDEGRVSSHTSMYAILLRALFLPSQIRNGSGNGQNYRDPDSRTSEEKLRFAKFKRDIYHRVLRIIFAESLGKRSHSGDCISCADGMRMVLYPAIPIASLDGKEMSIFTATRGPLANYPCSRCLVRGDQLHDIFTRHRTFELRTTESMKAVYEEAAAMQYKTHAEEHLQSYGLYSTENTFWPINNSDPYESSLYEILHEDDAGKFGKKAWPRLQEVLATLGNKGILTSNMRHVPRWPGLKHFDTVTTKDINDGQSYLDIEKCVLPCVAQLLPKNSPFIHAIRAHASFRMLRSLHCISEDQIQRKEVYQMEYGKWCMKISEQYPQYSYNFPKQHDTSHSSADTRNKGAPSVYCSRVNEGFHQENREAYGLGNKRNNDKHLSEIDATKEAMARIRMAVDDDDKDAQQRLEAATSYTADPAATTSWIDPAVRNTFDADLHRFIRDAFPNELDADGAGKIMIRPYKCIYVHYTSLEDWTDKCDILRCNPDFQVNSEQRFDSVVVNMDDDPLSCARMLYLFRCSLLSDREEDVALVRFFKKSRWQPKTAWKNCRVLEDGRTRFILPRYFTRGVHLINAFGCKKESSTFYLNDLVDADWFLRTGN